MHQSVTLQASLARDPGPPPFPHYLYFTNNPFMIIITIKVLLGEHPRREVHPVNRREPSVSQGRTHHTVSTAQVQHADGCDEDDHWSPKANPTTHPTQPMFNMLMIIIIKTIIIIITTISVLDLGCGDGMVGSALRDRGFSSVHGMDLSPGMLAK